MAMADNCDWFHSALPLVRAGRMGARQYATFWMLATLQELRLEEQRQVREAHDWEPQSELTIEDLLAQHESYGTLSYGTFAEAREAAYRLWAHWQSVGQAAPDVIESSGDRRALELARDDRR